jgi:hypothetical protein
VYHRRVIPRREGLLQLARLIGIDVFSARFGSSQSAEPDAAALDSLIDERLDDIARALVEEAASSDDVTDLATAASYLEDRLVTLSGLLSSAQAQSIRSAFAERTRDW